MSDAGDPDVTRLLRDLTRELQTLQRDLEPGRRGGVPSRRQLSRFTSEVAIPGVILVLEANIRALELLRRTIRLAEGRDTGGRDGKAGQVREQAERLGAATLDRLDGTLAEVQSSIEERGADDETRELLTEARELQRRIREQIEAGPPEEPVEPGRETGRDGTGFGTGELDDDPVTIDVEDELRTLKDSLEDDGGTEQGTGGDASDGSDDDTDRPRDGTGRS